MYAMQAQEEEGEGEGEGLSQRPRTACEIQSGFGRVSPGLGAQALEEEESARDESHRRGDRLFDAVGRSTVEELHRGRIPVWLPLLGLDRSFGLPTTMTGTLLKPTSSIEIEKCHCLGPF